LSLSGLQHLHMDWQKHLIDDAAGIHALLARTQRVAVLGIKPESLADQPAFYVPQYLQRAGLQVDPVPVYHPDVEQILGQSVVRRLVDLAITPDLVDVFRRPVDLPAHVEDLLACGTRAVWLQQGIRHAGVAEQLARAGIDVVQDRCLMVEHRIWQAVRR